MKKCVFYMMVAGLVLTTACDKKEDKDIPPTLTTAAASDITFSSATLGGNITGAGTPEYSERGVCYGTAAEPTTGSNKMSESGTGTGSFSVEVTGLSSGTTYYARAYAVHTTGTEYGNEVSFTTLSAELTVTTHAASNITATTASLGGNISDVSGSLTLSERGVCYATTEQPTTADNKMAATGTGMGDFSVEASGLDDDATYYVRAYAILSSGSTIYGNQLSFTTDELPEEAIPPLLTTLAASNITATTAIVGGNITDAGTPEYSERGVCYGYEENPTTDNNKTPIAGTGTGEFSIEISGLEDAATYYVRAYAIHETGTVYGVQISFKTLYSFEPEMILVEAGIFTMGGDPTMEGVHNGTYPQREVTLTKDYYIGKFPVTEGQWKGVIGSLPSDLVSRGDNYPMGMVTWLDVQNFITALNTFSGKNYRLPTEAEWEYAARGGNQSGGYKYAGSNNADEVSWNIGNTPGSPRARQAVGLKLPNELGIYDLCGNVWEWCSDRYAGGSTGYGSSDPVTDPQGATEDSGVVNRARRGGSYEDHTSVTAGGYNDPNGVVTPNGPMDALYVAFHDASNAETYKLDRIGFRLVLSAE